MAKLGITNLEGNTWMIHSPANIGIYVLKNRVWLMDSGNDKEAGKQILKLIKANGWELEEIINTHSHADHIGGNAYLQQNTGCGIRASRGESVVIREPLLEPSFLWGSYPFGALRNKFLQAKPSEVTKEIAPEEITDEAGLEIISLKGHSYDMIGIKTPDKVIFVGDSVLSKEIIEKYHLAVLYNVEEFLKSLDKLEKLDAKVFVPSHGKPVEDIKELTNINRDKVLEIIEVIYDACLEPISFEGILEKMCMKYNIELNINQYVLVGSTIRSYISYMNDNNRLEYLFDHGKMLWKVKK